LPPPDLCQRIFEVSAAGVFRPAMVTLLEKQVLRTCDEAQANCGSGELGARKAIQEIYLVQDNVHGSLRGR
jgi:hypothetical protein